MNFIDFRSDTVTKPSKEMRIVMSQADVGDDVYGDDPTVNSLEKLAADIVGTESAIFASSGTQTNLLALLSHCQRGDEYIVGNTAHTYMYEGGGAAVLGSIQPNVIEFNEDKTIPLDKVERSIKPDDVHFARTRLFCLENTNFGKILPLSYIKEASDLARIKKLKMHLDGARVFNASVGLGVDVKEITKYFNSVSICLSKGLGAPIGSLLCGDKTLVKEARKWRKMLGGGMRQAGIIAAAGIYALEHNINRITDDHENADYLVSELLEIEEINVIGNKAETNMVFIHNRMGSNSELSNYMKSKGFLISAYGDDPIRIVMHLDITKEDIKSFIDEIKSFFFEK